MRTNDVHIALPTSKSLSNRWLMVNHVTDAGFVLKNLSTADDTQLLQALLGQLRRGNSQLFYCRNAGSTARFMMALLALTPGTWTLTGDERLKQRPMAPLIECLRSLGSNIICTGQEGFLPVTISGAIPDHKMAEIDPVASSQFVSAMLLVGALMPDGLRLTLTGRASSRPYIQMTQAVMAQGGISNSVSTNNRVYKVEPISPIHHKIHKLIEIERDWSSASYIYGAAALVPHTRLRMQGLSLSNSCQGDKVTAEIFSHLGVVTHEVKSPYKANVRSITVEGTGEVEPTLEYNFIDCPDLLPVVITTCAALGVAAKLKGVKNLRIKESDRLLALQTELRKMGGQMTFDDTQATIIPSTLNPTQPVCSHDDHRIAMAFGILKLKYPNLVIEQPESTSKSFPEFWEQLELIRKEKEKKGKTNSIQG